MSILDDLNPEQRSAASLIEGPVLIFAGAGSGKTRTLTYRIAYMVTEAGIKPAQILAVTFTNKAADEMKSRILGLIGARARSLWAGTFHSVCARILRIDGEALGIPSNFVVFDEGDQTTLVRQALRDANYDCDQYKPADVLHALGRAKDELVGPEEYRRTAKGPFERVVAAVYDRYQAALRENRALDFDDLILRTVELFETLPEVLDRWQERFRYVLVDEYQDINYAQYRFVRLLAAKYRNICVVGDDDQSIYGWRGANVGLILRFQEDYPDARVVYLERNYRSTQHILECANAVISRNPTRAEKRLWTDNPHGDPVVIYQAVNESEEAEWVAQLVQRLRRTGYSAGDVAVLYRTNAMSRRLEEALMRSGIPYRIVGGVRFYARAEIKDMLAYLRLIHNPADGVSARRILQRPPRGIGEKTQGLIEQRAAAEGISFLEACRALGEDETLRPRARNALAAFVAQIDGLREQGARLSLPELSRSVAERTGYLQWLRGSSKADDQERADNIEEFVTLAEEFADKHTEADLVAFLEHVALMSDIDEAGELGDAVALMTLHAAKGLEFPVVVICGLEEGVFPHERSMGNDAELEEERRLCYVGITRAKQRLYLSHCHTRTIYGQLLPMRPSRFLGDLPDDHVHHEGAGLLMAWSGNRESADRPEETDKPLPRRRVDLVTLLDSARAARTTQARSPASRPAPATLPPKANESVLAALRPGTKINHPKFGCGTIVALEREGDSPLVAVAFEQAGIRKLAADYIKPEWLP